MTGVFVAGCAIARSQPAPSPEQAQQQLPQASQVPHSKFQGQVIKNSRPAPDFTLIDQNGQPFHFRAGNSEATLIFFGYTFCPDVCPGTMAEFRQVIKALGPDAKRVQFIFVSVDPERDSPERLKEYLARFSPNIIGLTGTVESVAEVVKDYGVVAEKTPMPGSSAGYLVSHTATAFLIDSKSQVRVKFAFGTSPEVMTHDVRELLAEGGRSAD